MNVTFTGRAAMLCGGSCHMALSLAPMLIRQGICPTLTYRNPKSLEVINGKLIDYSGAYSTCFLDLSHKPSVEEAFSTLTDGLDYLVDFAQGDYEELVASAGTDQVGKYMETNIAARATMLKLAGRTMMKKRHGRLVFVSSAAAERPNLGQGFYAASKLASEALYKNMALELGRFGISTVTLRPGYVESGRGERFIESHRSDLLNRMPSGSFLTPNDVAMTLLFLLSDQAKGFNATELTMDGGFSAVK